MKRETLVNIVMVLIVGLVVGGSGVMIYKNLLDKEAKERKLAIEKLNSKKIVDFEVLKTRDGITSKKEGFIFYKGKMYETSGEAILPMHANVLLVNGTKVLMDGTVINNKNKTIKLAENQMIDLTGDIVQNTRVMISPTPSITNAVKK